MAPRRVYLTNKKERMEDNNKRGVYTLKIGDKSINLLFSMNYWRILSQEGISMESLGETLNGSKGMINMMESLSKMVIAGGKSYSSKYKTKFEHSFDEVFDWFEEDITEKEISDMIKVMMDTKVFGKSLNQGLNRKGEGKQTPSQK